MTTPLNKIIGLDPVHGKQTWPYDPHIDKEAGYGDYVNRRASTWQPRYFSFRGAEKSPVGRPET